MNAGILILQRADDVCFLFFVCIGAFFFMVEKSSTTRKRKSSWHSDRIKVKFPVDTFLNNYYKKQKRIGEKTDFDNNDFVVLF